MCSLNSLFWTMLCYDSVPTVSLHPAFWYVCGELPLQTLTENWRQTLHYLQTFAYVFECWMQKYCTICSIDPICSTFLSRLTCSELLGSVCLRCWRCVGRWHSAEVGSIWIPGFWAMLRYNLSLRARENLNIPKEVKSKWSYLFARLL